MFFYSKRKAASVDNGAANQAIRELKAEDFILVSGAGFCGGGSSGGSTCGVAGMHPPHAAGL